jgi:hypothetical protein
VIEDCLVHQVSADSAEALYLLLSAYANPVVSTSVVPILLHYVGYGYARRGCPTWLIEGLEHWRTSTANSWLVIMFHEVYASGPPWTSAFWLSGQQRKLAARLVQLSDRCVTSKQLYARVLHQLGQGKQIESPAIPVFSNVGEPTQVPPVTERAKQLVVFGGCGSRLRVYQNSWLELSQACQQLAVREILDVGPSIDIPLPAVNGVPIVKLGQLPAPKISDLLVQALAGFFNYPTDFLAKSGIFASYCAHGVFPVSAQSGFHPVDGIAVYKHFWTPGSRSKSLNISEIQAIANNAYAWYQTHSLPVQAKIFATHLNHQNQIIN